MAMGFSLKPSPSLLLGLYPQHRPEPSGFFAALESRLERLLWRRQYRVPQQRRNIQQLRLQPESSCPLSKVISIWEKNNDEKISDKVIAAANALQNNRALVELGAAAECEEATQLAALAMASTGVPVHLVFDASQSSVSPNFISSSEQLGITIANLADGKTLEQRRLAYRADIVLVSFRQLMFDYLLDQRLFVRHKGVISGRLRQRILGDDGPLLSGFIVDARTVLIDSANQPMALSDGAPEADSHVAGFYQEAIHCAREMSQGRDYLWNDAGTVPVLLEQGEHSLLELTADLGPLWRGVVRAQTIVLAALISLHLDEDSDYALVDGKVQIEDHVTPQVVLEDISISDVKRLLLAKHDLPDSTGSPTISRRLSLQHFFPRYIHFSAAGWLLQPRRAELEKVYALFSVPIFEEQKLGRIHPTLCRTSNERYDAVSRLLGKSIVEQNNILLLSRSQDTLEELHKTLKREHAVQLCQPGSAGEMNEVGGLFISMTMEEALAQAKGEGGPGVFQCVVFVDTPSSILEELLIRDYLCSTGETLMFASPDEGVFNFCSKLYRALMPYSPYVYRLIRRQIERLEGRHRAQVAAHDAYVRQTLAFKSDV